MNAGVILFLIFAVCVLIGVPISMSLASALWPLWLWATWAFRLPLSHSACSAPAVHLHHGHCLLHLAGNLMAGGGISRRIVNFANCLMATSAAG